MNDENSIVYDTPSIEAAREIVRYLEEKRKEMKRARQSGTTANISNADELKKYKELLDAGVISQEEFDAKKKQLLGL